jgi:hypothetical protein
MTNWIAFAKAIPTGSVVRRAPGFVLGELLVFLVILTGLSMWLLPLALQARQVENGVHARAYLRMISSAQQVWQREMGVYVDLRRLAQSIPIPPEQRNHARTPGMSLTPPLIFDGLSIAHRGGYRFLVGTDGQGKAVGCWAWPNLRGYSGSETYWIDFSTSLLSVSSVHASWNDTPGTLAPAPEDLSALMD